MHREIALSFFVVLPLYTAARTASVATRRQHSLVTAMVCPRQDYMLAKRLLPGHRGAALSFLPELVFPLVVFLQALVIFFSLLLLW